MTTQPASSAETSYYRRPRSQVPPTKPSDYRGSDFDIEDPIGDRQQAWNEAGAFSGAIQSNPSSRSGISSHYHRYPGSYVDETDLGPSRDGSQGYAISSRAGYSRHPYSTGGGPLTGLGFEASRGPNVHDIPMRGSLEGFDEPRMTYGLAGSGPTSSSDTSTAGAEEISTM